MPTAQQIKDATNALIRQKTPSNPITRTDLAKQLDDIIDLTTPAADSVAESMLAPAVRTKLNTTGGGASFPASYAGTGNTTPSLYISHSLNNSAFAAGTTGHPDFTPLGLQVDYQVDTPNVQNPYDLTNLGLLSYLTYGGPQVNARGTVHARTTLLDVQGSASQQNEFANDMGWMRAGSATKNAAPGRYWFTDWNLHGAINSQVGLLNGVTMFLGNYYDGQPSAGPSGAYWAVSKPQGGGGSENGHNQATAYPVAVGFGVVGFANNNRPGFEVGFKVGGYGSGWMDNTMRSRIGTGLRVEDVMEAGVGFGNPHTGAVGVQFASAPTAWKWLLKADEASCTDGALLLPATGNANIQWGTDNGSVSLTRQGNGILATNGVFQSGGEKVAATVIRGTGTASMRITIVATDQGSTTVTLPPANSVGGGRLFGFTHAGGGSPATIQAANGDVIGESPSFSLPVGGFATFMSDGSVSWFRVG